MFVVLVMSPDGKLVKFVYGSFRTYASAERWAKQNLQGFEYEVTRLYPAKETDNV